MQKQSCLALSSFTHLPRVCYTHTRGRKKKGKVARNPRVCCWFCVFTIRLICCWKRSAERWGMEQGCSLQQERRSWCCVWYILIFPRLKPWSIWRALCWHLQRVLPYFSQTYLHPTGSPTQTPSIPLPLNPPLSFFSFGCLLYCNSRVQRLQHYFDLASFVFAPFLKAATQMSFFIFSNCFFQQLKLKFFLSSKNILYKCYFLNAFLTRKPK